MNRHQIIEELGQDVDTDEIAKYYNRNTLIKGVFVLSAFAVSSVSFFLLFGYALTAIPDVSHAIVKVF